MKSNLPTKINCYLPSGEKCPLEKTGINMNETSKFFEPKKRTWFTWYNGYYKDIYKGTVVLKAFTREPLYIVFDDKNEHTSQEVKDLIEKADYDFYFGEYNSGLKMDLQKFIKAKTITDTFLLETLGSPTKSYESYYNGKTVMVMDYSYLRIKIYLLNSIAFAYDEY